MGKFIVALLFVFFCIGCGEVVTGPDGNSTDTGTTDEGSTDSGTSDAEQLGSLGEMCNEYGSCDSELDCNDENICVDNSPNCEKKIVYLNRLGQTFFTPGLDNSIDNTTPILNGIDQAITFTSFSASQTVWELMLSDLDEIFEPFRIDVVENDPGDVPHIEIVITDDPSTTVGIGADVPSIFFRPLCELATNPVGVVFASVVTGAGLQLETVVAQVVGNMTGLNYLASGPDIMNLLGGEGLFVDSMESNCGWPTAVRDTCRCAQSEQNSFQAMAETCLLYTSPSPRDATLSRMPSSA